MNTSEKLKPLKEQIKLLIRSNSERGFLPYSGCNQVCVELIDILNNSKSYADQRYVFDLHLLVLVETIKLISHADTSSGLVSDVIHDCLQGIKELCQSAEEKDYKYFFDAILKAVKNKAFEEWEEYGYALLRQAVHFVDNVKQANKVFGLFPVLGPMVSGKDYPDMYLITYEIKLRLEGETAAHRYMMENLEVDELRVIAVENALEAKQYELAEQLCKEAMKEEYHWSAQISQWALFLERLYTEMSDTDQLIHITRHILFGGHTSYYSKLKKLYLSQGLWSDEQKRALLQQLSRKLTADSYGMLLQEEGELQMLLQMVQNHPYLIAQFGKQLAELYPIETNSIYELYIMEQAILATNRREYRGVCKLIKNYSVAIGKSNAVVLIERLCALYPRRTAMLDELAKERAKLEKKSR